MTGGNPTNTQLRYRDAERCNLKFPVVIVAIDIDSGVNVGSIFRIADALGVSKLYLTGGSPTPPSPKIRKTSRATEKAVSYEYVERATEVIAKLRADGYAIVSLEITTRSTDIRKFDARAFDKLALIVGSENHGVTQPVLDASDHTLHIPMFGQNSSMNLATACAIAVFEITRQFMPEPLRSVPAAEDLQLPNAEVTGKSDR